MSEAGKDGGASILESCPCYIKSVKIFETAIASRGRVCYNGQKR